MTIAASAVKELREKTGAGMMDCKKALEENAGNFDKAIEWLRVKGLSKAAKKSDRVAAEGTVAVQVSSNLKTAVLLEVNAETDFVARNDKFQEFVKTIATHLAAAASAPQTVDELLSQTLKTPATKVSEYLAAAVANIGENLVLRRFTRYDVKGDGIVTSYLHGNGRIGVLVEVTCNAKSAQDAKAAEFAKDVAMQIAAVNPVCISQAELPKDLIEKERTVLRAKALEEGKKAEFLDKIVEGQIKKWAQEKCLLDQSFVKNPDMSIKDYLAATAKVLTDTTFTIKRFVRFELGDGIEKRKDDFAAEVAAAAGLTN